MAGLEYTDWIRFPTTQLRVEIDVAEGSIRRFVVQLEYDANWSYDTTEPSRWEPIARFDHEPNSTFGHDIVEEGLHLDVYRDGEKHLVQRGFPQIPLSDAPAWCEGYLRENASSFVDRFEAWHGLDGP